MRTRRQLPLTTTVISPLPKIPTAQHGCNGCAEKESDRMMSTREKHPKIHRIALVDNDPRALDSLSAVIASKVPTAYVVWTATSGCEAIERCQDANGHVSLLILDMSMEGLQGPATCRRLRLMASACRFSVQPVFPSIVIGTSWLRLVRKGWLVRRMPTSWRRLLCVCAMAR